MINDQNGRLTYAAIVAGFSVLWLTLSATAQGGQRPEVSATRTVSELNITARATLAARWILGPHAFRDVVLLYGYEPTDACALLSRPLIRPRLGTVPSGAAVAKAARIRRDLAAASKSTVATAASENASGGDAKKITKDVAAKAARSRRDSAAASKSTVATAASGGDAKKMTKDVGALWADDLPHSLTRLITAESELISGDVALVTASAQDAGSTAWTARNISEAELITLCMDERRYGTSQFIATEYPIEHVNITRIFIEDF